MIINVEFIGFPELKAVTGKKALKLEFYGSTFSDLIELLEKKYKERFKGSILNKEGIVDSTVQILKNNSNWIKRDDSSQQLKDGDKIIFMRMMGGG